MNNTATTPTHDLNPGDHLAYSWGYDQTNVDYFIVTRVTAKSVWIAPVKSMVVQEEISFMTNKVRPTNIRKTEMIFDRTQTDPETGGPLVIGEREVPEVRKSPKVSSYDGKTYLSMDHGCASKVEAFAEHRESHYA